MGFAFGAAAVAGTDAAFLTAFGLALGIAIQNFPEGAAVALPLKQVTGSRGKAFLYGMGSGVVEPIAAVAGYFLAAYLTAAQPWLLVVRRGRDDLRRGGGSHSGCKIGVSSSSGNLGRDDRVCDHDDAGRRFGIDGIAAEAPALF